MESHDTHSDSCGLAPPRRNRYFYGKLLDAYHFELETEYFNAKRRLLNRLITGYGVVCGLDVKSGEEKNTIVVTSGLAIDKHGREILVDGDVGPLAVPEELIEAAAESEEDCHAHLVLCYHECPAEPAPVLAGACGELEPCQPGVIHERFRIEFRPDCLPPKQPTLGKMPDVIDDDGKIDYPLLVQWVADVGCPACDEDPCIPLANLMIDVDEEPSCLHEIDISIRPLVYTNDLLFKLILAAAIKGETFGYEPK